MILASASPRRRELLEAVGFVLTVLPADVDESRAPGESPTAYVARLARLKAHATLATIAALPPGEALVAADTIVHTAAGVTLGKPSDDEDAHAMLRILSGTTHHVSTGVCVMVGCSSGMREEVFVETTDVTFSVLSDAEIAAYVASGEPHDKAGAYGIQGMGRLLVRGISGDYANVVGLPVARVVQSLARLGFGPRGAGPLLPALLAHGGRRSLASAGGF